MHIFVVDDDPDIAKLIGEMLGGAGHRVTVFTEPHALLAGLGPEVDLVISDFAMGGMNGLAVADEVARRLGVRPPRTLLISACGDDPGLEAAPVKSVLGLMRKPFSLARFNAVVAVLEQSRGSCPCRVKALISCPETRNAAEEQKPDKVGTWCITSRYSECPEYETDCGQRLRDWIAKKKP